MKLCNKNILIFSIIFLASCSTYQHHFGGKSGDYVNATVTDALEYPADKASLSASDFYSVPAISATDQTAVITPPDYQD